MKELISKFWNDAKASHLVFQEDGVRAVAASLLSKRFLIASGLAGAGKTKLAQAFSLWVSPATGAKDPFTPNTRFESDRVTYVVKNSDSIAVEFWNEEGADGPTKNMVPREVIAEWADYIESNGIPQTTITQVISDAIEAKSRFSAYLHRFRPFLKLAAFALIKARQNPNPGRCCEVIPVGADWTGNDAILGYPDGIDPKRYVTRPALELIRRANDTPGIPHFLILDEMNLSHVERYFADILSAIESGEPIPLYEGEDRLANGTKVPQQLPLPPNLFIIGTVNVDETTYMFSPKVLDRANVIEFRMDADEMKTYLAEPNAVDLGDLAGGGESFAKSFAEAAANKDCAVPESVSGVFKDEMMLFFNILKEHHAEFGFRTGYEAGRFKHFYEKLGAEGDWFPKAMDAVIVQKLLPKLHGSRTKLEGLLWALAYACGAERGEQKAEDFLKSCQEAGKAQNESTHSPDAVAKALNGTEARYPMSFEKILRMYRKLMRDQFVTFAEA